MFGAGTGSWIVRGFSVFASIGAMFQAILGGFGG